MISLNETVNETATGQQRVNCPETITITGQDRDRL